MHGATIKIYMRSFYKIRLHCPNFHHLKYYVALLLIQHNLQLRQFHKLHKWYALQKLLILKLCIVRVMYITKHYLLKVRDLWTPMHLTRDAINKRNVVGCICKIKLCLDWTYLRFLLYCKHKGEESPRKIRWKCRKLKRYETTYTTRGNTSCLCTQVGNERPLLPCRYPNDSSLRTALPAGISIPPRSQTLRCTAVDHEGMRDLKFSQWCCWRFKSSGTSRRVSSTRRSEESSCLYYIRHYSPKKILSLPKRTRVYTEWWRHKRNVPQVFANQWG
jgi:hypothetical protein